MAVTIRDLPEQRLAAVRHIGPYPEIGQAFARLGAAAQAAGLLGRRDIAMVGVYYDDPAATPAAELRSDAAVVQPPAVATPAGLEERLLPAGRYAVATHLGGYDGLPAAWRRLTGEWLPTSGLHAAARPSYEHYVNDPSTTPADALRTDLYLPID